MSDIADCIIGWVAALGCGAFFVEFIVRVAQ